MRIYKCTQIGFGDKWAWISHMAKREHKRGFLSLNLSTLCQPLNLKGLKDIIYVMKVPVHVRWVRGEGTIDTREFRVESCKEEYLPTKEIWKPRPKSKSLIIGYQIESPHHHNWNKNKLFTNKDHLEFGIWLNEKNIKSFKMGLPMTTRDIVHILCCCDVFVGIDSGISHIAHSVGIPTLIKNWKQGWRNLDIYHPCKSYKKFSSISECRMMEKEYGRG